MTNKILFIANWKMFGTKKTVKTINNVIKFSKRKHNKKAKIIYCPPYTLIGSIVKKTKNSEIDVGAQNCHESHNYGANTGQINSNMIKAVGAKYVILGHSENRVAGETDEDIKIGPFSLFKGKMFDIFSKKQKLRPFELATRRLMNMIEILSNWNTYVPDTTFLTQRGATILLNEKDDVLYEFVSESLLGYSSKMSSPLSFIDDFLN